MGKPPRLDIETTGGFYRSTKSLVPRPPLPGTSLLAWRNLVHERARFIVTLVGILFSVVLMGIQGGLLIGFIESSGGLVAHSTAELWLVPKGTTNADITATLTDTKRQLALAVPGVARADNTMLQFTFWRKPDGGTESVALLGINPYDSLLPPWNLEQGRVEDLQQPDAIIIERLYAEKLGVGRLGDSVEINGKRARVVGITRGIRTFTQSPYLFTTHANAQRYTLPPNRRDRTTYVLVKTAPGHAVAEVQAALRTRMPEVDVWTAEEFRAMTVNYWLVKTGAGSAVLMAAVLGLIVGVVIVGQTLYSSTIDRLSEYATLRAMGAPGRYLYAVILKQAVISAIVGYAVGLGLVLMISAASQNSPLAISLPPWMLGVLALLTLAMCLFGAVISIRRVMHIDPTSVFR
ncbi:MAG: ABC transporter permease [Gammaproteobacteria bacterium]|nr:ABC transporter permease [Gammaproteobacteria bacterium]